MDIIGLTKDYKDEVERVVADSYCGLQIAVHRELYDLRKLPCLIALSDKQELLGYCYYRFENNECEIMVLESIQQSIGVGTALIKKVEELAHTQNCTRIYLQTTNDNAHAFRFYQRRGFIMCDVRWNELDYSRKLNPTIPLVGDNDIPALHEIEFEMIL